MKRIFLFSIIILFVGCSNSQIDSYTYLKPSEISLLSKTDDKNYINRYFDFVMTLPESSFVMNELKKDFLMDSVAFNYSEEEFIDIDAIKREFERYALLMLAYRYNPNKVSSNNSSLECYSIYLNNKRYFREAEHVNYAIYFNLEEIYDHIEYIKTTFQKINGTEYAVMDLTIMNDGVEYNQKYYSLLIGGYGLCFQINYSTESDLEFFESAINTIDFNVEFDDNEIIEEIKNNIIRDRELDSPKSPKIKEENIENNEQIDSFNTFS